jgi:hypothetical protein
MPPPALPPIPISSFAPASGFSVFAVDPAPALASAPGFTSIFPSAPVLPPAQLSAANTTLPPLPLEPNLIVPVSFYHFFFFLVTIYLGPVREKKRDAIYQPN